MPPSLCSESPGPSDPPQSSKHAMSDPEPTPQGSKKPRTNEPRTRRDSNRDAKRRRRRKKKVPVVDTALSKNDQQSRPEERSRAPLSARNEIIRFTSPPPSVDSPSKSSSQTSPSKPLEQAYPNSPQLDASGSIQDRSKATPSIPEDTKPPDSSSITLGDEVARLEAELKSRNNLIASHQALLSQIQQAATCQVCLDLMYKPYALAPCGHLVCHTCLVSWFTAPPPDNRPVPPPLMRKKTCPHCRGVVRERPIEVWGVKGIAQAIGRSDLVLNPSSVPVTAEGSEGQDANVDPWKDIFPKPGADGRHGLPWFLPGDDIDEDDIPSRGEDVGMLDMEDGGIYRCLDCMHEIWDGVCSSCGRVYPGHRHGGDDEDDELGWIDDQIGAEEVDVAEDPGWMGLEDGDADDGGNFNDWGPFMPWRGPLNVFRGPWGFFGTIHVDDEDEEEEEDDDEDDEYGRVDNLRGLDEGEDDGYESSFIDDDDEGGRARIYEISNEGGEEGYYSRDLGSDDHEEDEHELSDSPEPRRSARLRNAPGAVSFEEEYYSPDDEHKHELSDSPEPRRSARPGNAPGAVSFEEEYYSPDDEHKYELSDSPEPRRSTRLRNVLTVVSSEEVDDSPPRRRSASPRA